MLEVKGHTGQITFDGQWVTIHRKGFLARASVGKGEKRLHISQISATQLKPAGPVMNGFIQFTVPGGNERRSKFGSQTRSASQDENSVVFTYQQRKAFEALRAAIDEAIAAHHTGARQPAAAPVSVADELAKLHGLVQAGVLTQADFEAAKRRLLGG